MITNQDFDACLGIMVTIRGHVQTIFGKINVIMTLRGGGGE